VRRLTAHIPAPSSPLLMVEDSAFEDNQVIGSAKEDMTLVAFANGA